MKKIVFTVIVLAICLSAYPVFSQTAKDTASLGLPGDNLDLYAVLDLFQKSKTIEDFEKSLNDEKTGINNLDLNLDGKVDFIKVVTSQKDQDFTFILQDAVTEKETQDVAVILLSKDKNNNVTLQIIGDPALYGKDYVIEPAPAVATATPNPAYKGSDAVVVAPPTTVVVVQSAPIVTYVYSPVYVPYYPPYYYGYYPPYYRPYPPITVHVYHYNSYHYHSGYHGGYGNTTVVVHNTNTYNNYNNNSRNSSTTVNKNNVNKNYNGSKPVNGSAATTRPITAPTNGSAATKSPSTTPSTNQYKGSTTKSPSTTPSTNQYKGSAATKSPSTTPSTTKPTQPSRATNSGAKSGGRKK
jgi:hypothetical protein